MTKQFACQIHIIKIMYEIFFISYNEPNADSNWKKLKELAPAARRIQNIKGIHQAHIEAAKKSFTKMLYVVDGDAEVLDSFNFDRTVEDYNTVYIWHSLNPVNKLEYGYGGIKLLPKANLLSISDYSVDMTTSLSDKIQVIPTVSNITHFNTDAFSTWRSAFRECVKLSSKVIDRTYDEETDHRLHVWCTVGAENDFGEYAISGANAGKKYGQLHLGNNQELSNINDFDWLRQQFEKLHG